MPTYVPSHVHPERLEPTTRSSLMSTFRVPVQIHTRSGNAKWLDEIAHTNPVWIHPADAERERLRTGDLVRVETEIGHFVARGVGDGGHPPRRRRVQPSHGPLEARARPASARRWRPSTSNATGDSWSMRRRRGVGPFESADPDTRASGGRDVGVHQNLTFPVHPDPISGMHCWHQAVRVRRAGPDDRLGDISVDTVAAHAAYHRWLLETRPAHDVSPDGTRRPYWLLRPLKPAREAYELPAHEPAESR